MIADTAELAVRFKLDDRQFQSSIAKDERSLKNLNSTVTKTGGAFKAAAGSIGGFQRNMGRAFSNLGRGVSTAAANIERMAFAAGALAVGGGIAAVKWAGDFEAQLRTINTIARETPEGLSKIGDSIREIARETGTPLEELTKGYYDLLSAGIKAADAQVVLTNANKLAIGGLASAAETVDLLTTAINVYGGDAKQASRFTDEFAKAIERGKVTAAELAASYAQVAPLAKSLNVENVELAAGYARLTASGTPAAEAATQMASAMTALLKKTPDLEKLEKQTRKNYSAIAGSQGLNVALEQMRVDAEKAGIDLVNLVGRKEALLYILQTTGPNLRAYNADLAAMGDAAGTAAAQMAERQQGLNFQLAKLRAGIKDAGIEIGSALIPKLVPLIERFNLFLKTNREGIKRFGADLANAFESVVKWLSRIDFDQVASSLRVAGTFARGLIEAFLAAPQWLQTAVVTGWGLNKLTGGAIQNIMADLTKATIGGVLQQFVARGSSPANPMFVSDVTGGLGGGDVLGKGGWVSKIALAIAAAVPVVAAKESGLLDQLIKGINETLFGSETAAQIDKFNQTLRRPGDEPPPSNPFAGGIFDPIRRTPVDNSPEARQARSDLRKLAQSALEDQRRGERSEGRLATIGSTLTAMQSQLHADLQSAIDVLRTSNDPAAIAAAAQAAITGTRGGAGSASTTKGLIGDLKAQLAAAEATGNTDLAAKIRDAIKQIEPFQRGRQWQAEQIAKAREIVASNKSTAQKTADLKRIQDALLSHQRTMAAEIVSGLADVVAAVKNVKLNVVGGTLYGGGGRPAEDDVYVPPRSGGSTVPQRSPNPDRVLVVNANVAVSTRDVNSAQNIKRRYGPTPTQAGAA